jgi:DNA-binding transcriptional LysR family regulator
MNITTDQLTVLLAIVDAGSFSAAARNLRRTQGSVSYHVARLEEQLGLQLFDRSGHRPRLTEHGGPVVDSARRVVQDLRHLQRTAQRLQEGLEPRVVVAVDVLTPPALLAEAGHAFRDRFPTVGLMIHAGILREPIDAVTDGQAMLAIGPVQLAGGLTARPCAEVQLLPVVAPHHPLAAEPAPVPATELERHVRLVLPASSTHEVQGQTWRVGDQYTRHQLVLQGLGWSRLPRHQVEQDLHSGRLVEIVGEPGHSRSAPLSLAVLHHPDRPPGPAGTWLYERLAAD